jgi:hypothetical protein
VGDDWQEDLQNLLDSVVNPQPVVQEDWRDHVYSEPDDILSDWVEVEYDGLA